MKPKTRRRLLFLGVFLVIISPPFFWTTCSDVGYGPDGPPGGYELEGFTGVTVSYTPDGGVNSCTAGLGPVYLPLGIALILISLAR